jgi:hypothetical protein
MAYSDFRPPRRSRRRRNITVLVVLLVIIGVLVLAVRYRTERRESIDYLTEAIAVAGEHAEMADRLGTLLQSLGQEDRPAVIQRLETLAAEAHAARLRMADLVVSRPVAEVSGLMTVAVTSWDDGIGSIDDAIVAILDAEDGDRSGDEALRSAFELLRLGDRAYAGAVDRVAHLDQEIVPAPMPTVGYVDGDFAVLYDSAVIAERLRMLGTLSEARDIKVVATTVPEPVSEGAGGIWTVPASDAFSLQVTVSNTGNVIAEKITVTVTLRRQGSSDAPTALSQLIPAIDEGASVTLDFDSLDVQPGQAYAVSVTAAFEDGPDQTDDNTWSLVFERNAE